MNNALALDIECCTFAKGNPYSLCGTLVSIHAYDGIQAYSYRPEDKQTIQNLVNKASTFIWFNAKFDISWLRKLGVVFPEKAKHYDVQLAHFYITNQSHPYPSLDDVAAFYKQPGKVDKVAALWEQGIDTDAIPWDILTEYGEQDVRLTYNLYVLQQDHWNSHPKKYTLFKLACQDMLVLQEMEWNGLYYDEELCHKKSQELQLTIRGITDKLAGIYPSIPINFNSNDQLSSFLYGGTVTETRKELDGFYKTGKKAGQPKFRKVEVEHILPRLFTPLPKTEMQKPGVFSTSEGTLRKLKGKHKWIVDLLLELAKLTKLDETYYTGLTKLNKEMDWPKGFLHGQFNQCIAKTGRLSSSKPNLQNLSGDSLDVFITRYEPT